MAFVQRRARHLGAARWLGMAVAVFLGACGGSDSSDMDEPSDEPSPNEQTSTITASPVRLLADGNASATIIVTVRDSAGSALSNQHVMLSSTGSGNTLRPDSGTTDADGVLMATLTSTVGGTKAVAATVADVELTASVSFTALPAPCSDTVLLPGLPSAPSARVAADFNGDGVLDLAGAADYSAVHIWLGKGAGTFHPPIVHGLAKPAQSMATGDLNGDDIPDLLVADPGHELAILLGVGDGSFQDGASTPLGALGTAIVTADFDADGTLDVAVAHRFANEVTVLLGDGDGGIQDAKQFSTGEDPLDLVAADLDGNGYVDLATSNAESEDMSVLLARGDGSFDEAVEYPLGSAPRSMVAGDFNGDGKVDLVAAGQVLPGEGDGTFGTPHSLGIGNDPSLTAADFDADGNLDLLAHAQHRSRVLLNQGDGTFATTGLDGGPAAGPLDVDFGTSIVPAPLPLLPGDFDGDGNVDVALPGRLVHGRGDGTFLVPTAQPAEISTRASAMGDFNGDGVPDLSVGGLGPVRLMTGRGDGGFEPQALLDVEASLSLHASDFDRDGNLDLIVLTGPMQLVSEGSPDGAIREIDLLLGRGDGTFEPPRRLPPLAPRSVTSMRVVDVDRDGRLDLLVGSVRISDYSAKNRGMTVLFGEGDGSFAIGPFLEVSGGAVAEDLDGDGKVDIAAGHSGQIWFYRGNGDGTFAPSVPSPEYSPGQVGGIKAAGDFDGDGNIDLVTLVTNESSDVVSLLFGNGDGTFRDPQGIPMPNRPSSYLVRDLNRDGHLDLVTVMAGSVHVLSGKGDGTFHAAVDYRVRSIFGSWLAADDLDGDGALDLVVRGGDIDDAHEAVSVLLQTGCFSDGPG